MTYPQIILLHGACSTGKTTLAHALRKALPLPYYYFSSDQLVDSGMLPRVDRTTPDTPWSWNVHRPRFFDGFHRSIAAFAAAGNNLLVEHIVEHAAWLDDLVALLRGYRVFYVGVVCPVEEMDRRERERGDRYIGEGRSHLEDGIHTWSGYDLTVDTLALSPEENAQKIIAAIEELGDHPTIFEQLHGRPGRQISA